MDSEHLLSKRIAMSSPERIIGDNHVRYFFDDVEKEAVWTPLRNGMRLYVTAPVSEIDGEWKSMVWNTLFASLLILALSALAVCHFSNSLTKPLRDLTEAASQIQNGNYDSALVYSGNDEVGLLTQTFKQLTAYTKEGLTTARRMAVVDSLTGLRNKRAYMQQEEIINEEIRKGIREPFAVAVCDINNLKAVNDLYGHQAGDTCIRNACAKICGIFKHSDVFRIGGDEFVVILSGEDYSLRNKLMEQINAVPADHAKIKIGDTIAAGMADYDRARHVSLSSVFEEADKAMYERKQRLKETVLAEGKDAGGGTAAGPHHVINGREQILVVDDVATNRELVGNILRNDYDILYASDGIETLNILRSHPGEIDLVLLDLQMPNMDGRKVIAEMQLDEELASIPVICLTVDQEAELDCLRSGAMDFIPKPFPDIEIVKARIAKCIELSENRELIRYTEYEKLTGLLNRDYFFRYVGRLDNIYKGVSLDAVACDVNHFHSAVKQYGRQFGDYVLRTTGDSIKKLARETGGIGCRQDDDTFLLYCPHQDNYETLIRDFISGILADEKIGDKVDLKFGLFFDAQMEPNMEERFIRADAAASTVKDDPQRLFALCD